MRGSYVMAGVVAVVAGGAFAMALRSDHGRDVPLDPVERARAEARADMQAAKDRAELEATTAAALAKATRTGEVAREVGGERPGQPGSLFDAIHFGSAGLSASPAELDRISAAATHEQVGVGFEPQRLTARVPPEVADRIFHAWGDPPRDHDLHDPGSNAALHVSVEGSEVVFAWRPYESLAHLIDPGDGRPPGVTPFSVVGAKVDELSLALGDRLHAAPRVLGAHAYQWDLPPMDDGTPVFALLDVDRGVFTRASVAILIPPDEVEHALQTTYGDGGTLGTGPWHHGALAIELAGHPPDGATVTAIRAR